jgi:hypothetical protein
LCRVNYESDGISDLLGVIEMKEFKMKYFLLWYRDSMFARSVSKLQKENLKNSFETAALPEGFLSGDEPTPEIGDRSL